MKIIQTFLGKIATICSGERRELLEDEEIKSGNNLPELLPGQVRVFNPAGMPIRSILEIRTERIIMERNELDLDTEMQE